MMYCPLVFSKMRKFRFSTKVVAIILSLIVLLIVSEGAVQSVTTTGEINSGSLNRLYGVSDYKISNNPYEITSYANSTLSGHNLIDLNTGNLNIVSGVASQMIRSTSPNTPLFTNYNNSIIEAIDSNAFSNATITTESLSAAVSLADISINYSGGQSLGIISKCFLYEANSTMNMNFKVTVPGGSIILFISNGYTQVANGFCTLNSVQINGNSINGLTGTSIQGIGGIWSSICPAYLQVNTSGIYNITANFKSTDGAITGYVLVIGPQQLVNPPANTNTDKTNFPYILLSAIAIGVIISSVVIVYTNKKEKGLKTRDSPDGP